MTRRRRNWLIAVALAAIVIGGGAWLAQLWLLPWVVRREVNAAFASVGLSNVRFDVRQASLFGTRIEGTGSAEDDIGLGAVAVRYSPWDAINGELKSITVSNARLEIDLDQPLTLGARDAKRSKDSADASFELPFERLELSKCALVLKRGDRELRLPVDGSIVRRSEKKDAADLTIASAIARSNLHVSGAIDGAAGRAHFTASASDVNPARLIALLPPGAARDVDEAGGSITFALDYRFDAGKSSASLQLALADVFLNAEQGMGFAVEGMNGAVTFDDLLAPSTPPNQTVTVRRAVVAGQELTDAVIAFQLTPASLLTVAQVKFHFGGGVAQAQPFTVDLAKPVIETTVYVDRAGLKEVVALVTQGRATGEGTISGSLPFALDLTDPQRFRINLGRGTLRADAPGTLRLGDASADFGAMMAKSDPTFETDPLKRELRDSVVEAVRDFRYDLLEVGFAPTADGDVAATMRIHGRGRAGGRLPLHLGLKVEGVERGLEAYLAAKSRVLSGGS